MVIEAKIKAEHLGGMTAFLRSTGHADYPTPFEFANLPDGCAYRPGGCCHHQRLSGFRLADIQQPHIRGKARHA
ncbi:hypothetical protein D3C73_1404840 [compost metagenome]